MRLKMRLIAGLLLAGCAAPPGAKNPGLMGGLFGDEAIIAADVMKYGFPGTAELRYRRSYVLSYDAARRVPFWVAERITPADLEGEPEAGLFRPDESFPDAVRVRNEDFEGSGFIRGRLASAANHRGDPDGYRDTYLLSNVSPQLGAEFRQTVWVALESAVRGWARDAESVYVVTGALFLPAGDERTVRYQLIGDRAVAVPTHFFKVLLAERGRERAMAAFLVPHEPIGKDADLTAFLAPVDEIEALSGLDFFPDLPEPTQSKLEKLAEPELWPRAESG